MKNIKTRLNTNSKFFLKLTTGLLLLGCLFMSTGCGSAKEVDKIGDAQQCLNEATSSTAMDCVTKVEGLTSTGSYNIRCAAAFVREGFANPTKYTTAFSGLSGGKGTSSFMGLVSFSSTANITTDAANAATTFSDCYAAGAKGKTLISAFGFFSTALMKFFADAGGSSATACKSPTSGSYSLDTCITQATTANPTEVAKIGLTTESDTSSAGVVQSSIGSVILSTYNISCSGVGANKELCSTLSSAITAGGSSPRSVFVSFFTNSVKTTQ